MSPDDAARDISTIAGTLLELDGWVAIAAPVNHLNPFIGTAGTIQHVVWTRACRIYQALHPEDDLPGLLAELHEANPEFKGNITI